MYLPTAARVYPCGSIQRCAWRSARMRSRASREGSRVSAPVCIFLCGNQIHPQPEQQELSTEHEQAASPGNQGRIAGTKDTVESARSGVSTVLRNVWLWQGAELRNSQCEAREGDRVREGLQGTPRRGGIVRVDRFRVCRCFGGPTVVRL